MILDKIADKFTGIVIVSETIRDALQRLLDIPIATFVGPKGDPGINGADGVDGVDGADGINGTNGIDGINGINGLDGADGAPGVLLVASDTSESESVTTSSSWVNKLTVVFPATLGKMYMINSYCEIGSVADEDVEGRLAVSGVEQAFAHFKNQPYAERWSQMNGAFYLSDALTGNITVTIDYRNGYGAGNKKIRRARLAIFEFA